MNENSDFLTSVDPDQLEALQKVFQPKEGDLMMIDGTYTSAIAVRMFVAFRLSLERPPAEARDRIRAGLAESFGVPVQKDSPEAIRVPTNMKELVQPIHTSDAKFSDANDDPYNILLIFF